MSSQYHFLAIVVGLAMVSGCAEKDPRSSELEEIQAALAADGSNAYAKSRLLRACCGRSEVHPPSCQRLQLELDRVGFEQFFSTTTAMAIAPRCSDVIPAETYVGALERYAARPTYEEAADGALLALADHDPKAEHLEAAMAAYVRSLKQTSVERKTRFDPSLAIMFQKADDATLSKVIMVLLRSGQPELLAWLERNVEQFALVPLEMDESLLDELAKAPADSPVGRARESVRAAISTSHVHTADEHVHRLLAVLTELPMTGSRDFDPELARAIHDLGYRRFACGLPAVDAHLARLAIAGQPDVAYAASRALTFRVSHCTMPAR